MFKKYKGKLFCFSPPVMLATFLIEFSFAIYTIWRYKMSTLKRLVVTTLLALGTFQLFEYMICGGLGLTHIDWARIGYGSITLLPAIGIHMVVTLAGKKKPLLVKSAYASCAVFLIFYLIGTSSVTHKLCTANYAVFYTQENWNYLFAIYYYGWLIIGTYLSWIWAKEMPKRRKSLKGMALGYMAFILPTTFFNIVDPSTVKGIPSIMCGFAVLFAFTLIFVVLPNSIESKVIAKKKSKAFQKA